MQERKLEDLGKPTEASLDWKPDAPLVQSEGGYATLTCSSMISVYLKIKENILL